MDAGAHSAFAHRGLGGGADPPEDPSSATVDDAELMFTNRGCCFFWVPYCGSDSPSARAAGRGRSWERIGGGAPAAASHGGAWWRRAMMRMREWSEVVAGPRWKTFIRRFNRHHRSASGGGFCGIGGGGSSAARLGKFQYDPLSYARNFDEGHRGQDGDADGQYVYRDFSARYVLPPSSAKSSMDLGGRDAPPLFHTPKSSIDLGGRDAPPLFHTPKSSIDLGGRDAPPLFPTA